MQLAAPMPSMCTWHHCTPQSPEPKWSVNPPNVINTALLMLNSFSFSFRKTQHSCAAVLPTLILFAPPIDIFRNNRRMDRGATTTAGEVISMTIRMRIQGHGSRRQAFGTAFFYFGCFVKFHTHSTKAKNFTTSFLGRNLFFTSTNVPGCTVHTHTRTRIRTHHTHTHTLTHTHTQLTHTLNCFCVSKF